MQNIIYKCPNYIELSKPTIVTKSDASLGIVIEGMREDTCYINYDLAPIYLCLEYMSEIHVWASKPGQYYGKILASYNKIAISNIYFNVDAGPRSIGGGIYIQNAKPSAQFVYTINNDWVASGQTNVYNAGVIFEFYLELSQDESESYILNVDNWNLIFTPVCYQI